MTTARTGSPHANDDETLDAVVHALQFLGDRNRLRIIKLLAQGETSVGALVDQLALPQPLVSYHLRRLREAGLVRAWRQARQIHYTIDLPAWDAVASPIRDVCNVVAFPAKGAAELPRLQDLAGTNSVGSAPKSGSQDRSVAANAVIPSRN